MPGQLILADGLRRKVWEAYYVTGLSKLECVLRFSGAIGRTQVYALLRDFDAGHGWERPSKAQRREALQTCVRGVPVGALQALRSVLELSTEDLFYDEIRTKLVQDHNIDLSVPQICEMITTPEADGGLGWSQTIKQRMANEKNQEERQSFREFVHVTIPPEEMHQVIAFDEMHRGRNEGRRKKGLSPVGVPAYESESFQQEGRQTFTLVAAINIFGCVPDTAWISELTVDSDMFYVWVLLYLCPVLGNYARGERNSIVWCDNVIQHLDDRTKLAIRETGAILIYLSRSVLQCSHCDSLCV